MQIASIPKDIILYEQQGLLLLVFLAEDCRNSDTVEAYIHELEWNPESKNSHRRVFLVPTLKHAGLCDDYGIETTSCSSLLLHDGIEVDRRVSSEDCLNLLIEFSGVPLDKW